MSDRVRQTVKRRGEKRARRRVMLERRRAEERSVARHTAVEEPKAAVPSTPGDWLLELLPASWRAAVLRWLGLEPARRPSPRAIKGLAYRSRAMKLKSETR